MSTLDFLELRGKASLFLFDPETRGNDCSKFLGL